MIFDYEDQRYYLLHDKQSSAVELKGRDKDALDNLFSALDGKNLLVKVLEVQEETVLLLEVRAFKNIINLNKLQGIDICVTKDILRNSKIKLNDDQSIIDYFNNEFLYHNMVFIRGYGQLGNRFDILGVNGYLRVKRIENRFQVDKYKWSRHGVGYTDAVSLIRGEIRFVEHAGQSEISPEAQALLDGLAKNNAYMNIWDVYNKLEENFVIGKMLEYGSLPYDGFTCELKENYEYKFNIVGVPEHEFPQDIQLECTADKRITDNDIGSLRYIQSEFVGRFAGIEDKQLVVVDEISDHEKRFPVKGWIFPSWRGDKVRLKRRKESQDKLKQRDMPIPYLGGMIAEGIQIENKIRTSLPAVTKKLEKQFHNQKFNTLQKKAIEVALNTPDIALILGPPGTGKTTVIRAIIARFEEEFHKKYDDDIPRILVSSFQHEAVDNVMTGLEGNGLPVNRIGGKDGKIENVENSLRQWSLDKTSVVNQIIDSYDLNDKLFEMTDRDAFLAWREKGCNVEEGVDLLKALLEKARPKLNIDQLLPVQSVINQATQTEPVNDGELKAKESIISTLEAQRLSQTSFEDDGVFQAVQLKLFIECGLIEYENGKEIIENVISSDGKDIGKFKSYVDMVTCLKSKYKKDETLVPLNIKDALEESIDQLINDLVEYELDKVENSDFRIVQALKDYIEDIQDLNSVQELVSRYSNINASTCQQVLSRNNTYVKEYKGNYDLVVIDEAARANPLDLLIPMVLAEKIVLVGDFLQLPHMLEPEVVKTFMQQEGEKSGVDPLILKESLFERLYRFYDANQPAVCRTARLSHQYRMNKTIGEFVSDAFYKDYSLDSSEVDNEKKQANLGRYDNKPIAWINLDGQRFEYEQGRISKFRECEVQRIIDETRSILKIDSSKTIGIISFYKAQSDLIKEKIVDQLSDEFQQQISVGTVDAFQGKEFDIVFLSCVRSNTFDSNNLRRKVGHIADKSRLCVALTRAKQMLILVGDRETVSCVPVLKDFIELCKNSGVGYYVDK